MKYIYEALGQLDTLISIKSPDYRIKVTFLFDIQLISIDSYSGVTIAATSLPKQKS